MAKRGLTAEYNALAGTIELYWNETVITNFPVPRGERDDMRVAWRRDRFVANRLAELFEHVASAEE